MAKHRKVAVVAGGSAGVGRAVVSRLIEEGYGVGVLARGRERLDELEEVYGDQVHCLACDVADADAVARAGAATEEVFGPVEIWVNSAMLTSFSPFMSMETEEFDKIIDATLLGVVNGTRTALSLMERRNRGRIVTAGSGLAYRSVPYQSAYCAAKHGVNGFMASVRSELIREGSEITVGLVQLPSLDTPQFGWALNRLSKRPQPAPPVFNPDVAARAIMRAVSEGGREYFVGRSVLQLVFANMVLPNWMDREMADSGAELQKSNVDEPGGRPNNLETPVSDVSARAEGRFGDRANDRAIVINADRARLVAFGALPLSGLLLGLLLG